MRELFKKTWMLVSLLWILLPLGQTVFAQSNPKLDPVLCKALHNTGYDKSCIM